MDKEKKDKVKGKWIISFKPKCNPYGSDIFDNNLFSISIDPSVFRVLAINDLFAGNEYLVPFENINYFSFQPTKEKDTNVFVN